MRPGRCVITVFPLFADPSGKGLGGGTLHIKPHPRFAYHTNSLGSAHYTQAILYPPPAHLLKVRPQQRYFCRLISCRAVVEEPGFP
jgi:hypothetical protein